MTDKRDAYLRRNYDIDVNDEARILQKQDYKCAVCGRDFFDKDNNQICRYEIDHKHLKFDAHKLGIGWSAFAVGSPNNYVAKTKAAAIKLAQRGELRGSVRGILCGGRYAGCNRKLGRLDKPEWLQAAHDYIADPPAKYVLTRA